MGVLTLSFHGVKIWRQGILQRLVASPKAMRYRQLDSKQGVFLLAYKNLELCA